MGTSKRIPRPTNQISRERKIINDENRTQYIYLKQKSAHTLRSQRDVLSSHWASKYCAHFKSPLVLRLIKWIVAWCLTSWSFVSRGWSIAYARTYSHRIIMRNRSNDWLTNAHFIGWNDEQYGWMDMMKVSVRIIAFIFPTKTAYACRHIKSLDWYSS